MKKNAGFEICQLKFRSIVLFIAIALTSALSVNKAMAAADATMSLVSTPQTVDIGDTFTLVANENPGTNANVRAVDILLQFDPAVLRLDSIVNGSAFNTEMANNIPPETAAGTASFGATRFGGANLVGAQDVATFTFTALAEGANSAVSFAAGTAIWDSGVNVTASGGLTGAQITVLDPTDATAPTITSVSSNKAAGTYAVDEVIDIDVNFSEAVTSTGNVTVTLETGTSDRTCTFTISNSATGTCNYTVQTGDSSSDLTVNTIAGTIADQAANPMTNFTPTTNLAANEALVIDTASPTGGSFTVNNNAAEATATAVTLNVTCPTDSWATVQMAFGNTANPTNWVACSATAAHTLTSVNGAKTVYMRFRDGGQNTTSDITDTITLNIADSTAPTLSLGAPSGTLGHTTRQVNLTLQTNESATCKYASSSGSLYANMTSVETALSTAHSFAIAGLTDGSSYGYYVKCNDAAGNSSSDYLIAFSIKKNQDNNKSDGDGHKKKKKSTPPRKISNSKKTVARGAMLIQRGKKFSKRTLVKLFFSKPGGGYYAPQTIKTSSTGSFVLTYRVTKPKGQYGWYALDTKTGKKSRIVYYKVK